MRKLLLLGLVVLLLVPQVFAWGILPARQLGEFTDDTQVHDISLRNTGLNEGFFEVDFGGELAPYATYLGPETLFFSANTQKQDIQVQLDLETAELAPGRNRLRIIFKQLPDTRQAVVTATVTLVAELVVDVPVVGEFVDAQLFITQARANDPTPFEISLVNKGEDAVPVYADVIIKGPTNAVIAQWSTEPFVLGFQQAQKIRTSWEGEKEPGTYVAEVIVNYGEKTEFLRDTFVVGSKEVRVRTLEAANFELGDINRIIFTAQNTWNDQLENVFAEVFVVTEEGQVVQSFRTNPQTFRGLETKQLEGFWDTTNLQVGKYTLNVVTQIGEESFQYSFPVDVRISSLQLVGNVVAVEDTGGDDLQGLLVIILIIVLISNVVLILYFKKKK